MKKHFTFLLAAILTLLCVTGVQVSYSQCDPKNIIEQKLAMGFCIGDSSGLISFKGSISTVPIKWINDNPAIGLSASGSGDISSFKLLNNTTLPIKARIKAFSDIKNGEYAYINNYNSGTVSVVDLKTKMIIANVATGVNPFGIIISADKSKVYVSNYNGASISTVSVISTASNTVIKQIPSGAGPRLFTMNSTGSKLFLTNYNKEIHVIDAVNDVIERKIPINADIFGIGVSPDDSKLYVGGENNEVKVISTATGTLLKTITVDGYARSIRIDPTRNRAYVSTSYGSKISVIDLSTDTRIATIDISSTDIYNNLQLNKDFTKLYVLAGSSGFIHVIDLQKLIVEDKIPHNGAYNGSFNSDGTLMYVTRYGFNDLDIVNLNLRASAGVITPFSGPTSDGPSFILNTGCISDTMSFEITVNPRPSASLTESSQQICSGDMIKTISPTSSLTGTEFSWTRDKTNEVSGISASGSGDISGKLINNSAAAVTVTFSIVPRYTADGITCNGDTIRATVVVDPKNSIDQQTNLSFCNGDSSGLIGFKGSVSGAQLNWINDNPAIGLSASGTGDISSFKLVNNTNQPIKARVKVYSDLKNREYAYIINHNSNTVSVVDVKTNTIISNITTGVSPYGILVSADKSKVYVSNFNGSSVSVISTVTNTVIKQIPCGPFPVVFAMNSSGSKIYLTSFGTEIQVIDAINDVIERTIPVNSATFGIGVSPDDSKLYVGGINNDVKVINATTGALLKTIPVVGSVRSIRIDPKRNRAYVCASSGSFISVIDLSTDNTIATINVSTSDLRNHLVINKDYTKLYLLTGLSGYIHVIDLQKLIVEDIIPYALAYYGSFNSDGTLMYITRYEYNDLDIFNLNLRASVGNIKSFAGPTSDGPSFIVNNGCVPDTMSFEITVNPTPQNFNPLQDSLKVCAKDQVLDAGSGFSKYVWTDQSTFSSIKVRKSGLYKVVVENTYGCSASDSGYLSLINANIINADSSICPKSTVLLQADTSTSIGLVSYTWSNGSNANKTLVSPSSSASYLLTASDGITTCRDSVRLTIVPVDTSLSLLGPAQICINSGKVDMVAGIANSYQWYRNGSLISNANQRNYSATQTGLYQVKLLNAIGCQDSSRNVQVSLNPIPSVSFTVNNLEQCLTGNNFSFTNTGSITSGTMTHAWNFGNGKSATTLNAVQSYASSGVFSVKLVSTSNLGCADSSIKTVTVNPMPIGTLVAPTENFICDGTARVLSATGGSTYQWYFNTQQVVGANAATFNALQAGSYTVDFISDKACVSKSSNAIVLSLIKKPQAAFTYTTYCKDIQTKLTSTGDVSLSGAVAYIWTTANGQSLNGSFVNYTFPASGSQNIKLVVTPNLCPALADSVTRMVAVQEPTKAIRYPAVNAIIGKSTGLSARNIGINYLWSPSTGLSSILSKTPDVITSAERQYLVAITSEAGCVTVDSQLVRIFKEREIYVPKAFTPDRDGVNDRIYPILVDIRAINHFRIFNRWGVLVYDNKGANSATGWDGTYKGMAQPMETYVWVAEGVDNDGNIIKRSGNIVLIR